MARTVKAVRNEKKLFSVSRANRAEQTGTISAGPVSAVWTFLLRGKRTEMGALH
jgi:hypothetical protein